MFAGLPAEMLARTHSSLRTRIVPPRKAAPMILGKTLTKIFGSRNDRLVKRYRKTVTQVNALEAKIVALTDTQLKDRVTEIRDQLLHKQYKAADVLPEALAIVRESMDRNIG